MPTFNSIPTTTADLFQEIQPYEEYLANLLPGEQVQAKAHLVATLSAMVEDHSETVLVLRAGLPPEQIRQVYLENLFPDESSAAAYLWALRPGSEDRRIREIEGEKRTLTDEMVKPLSHRRRQHQELLEMVWAIQGANAEILVGRAQTMLVKLFTNYSDETYQEFFDTWANAEITRVRMRRLIQDLRQEVPRSREEVIRGTYLQKSRVSLRHWIIAAAFVSQTQKCTTPEDLRRILGIENRITPGKMLHIMKNVMAHSVRKGNFHLGYICVVDDLVAGFRLFYQNLGKRHNTKHRNDLMLRGIGNMMVQNPINKGFDSPRNGLDYKVRKSSGKQYEDIHVAFNDWIEPYRNAPDEMETYDNLAEFAFRYQDDKRRLMGWRLINHLLRMLMEPEIA